jgi:uncharacterized protein YndB with AHSA1/START domain
MTNSSAPVSVSRQIDAPAATIFRYLAVPANHPAIDGSGMVKAEVTSSVLSGVGDVFDMEMHNDEMGDYVITNHIVEFEPDRKITWEPVLKSATRPEDQEAVGDRAGHRWGFELSPRGERATIVTETFDCSQAPEWLQKVLDGGQRWVESMTITLEKLDSAVTF